MLIQNDKQRELVNRIDCSLCSDNRVCDRIRCECPKVNFYSLEVDDVSILKSEIIEKSEPDVPNAGFTETSKREFETHLYGSISRCRFRNKILSFFSSEKEVKGHLLFFFSHNGYYYRSFRDNALTDTVLEEEITNFLYPDNKSFEYQGWLCKFIKKDRMFHLFTPNEREQPSGVRYPEMEVSSPAQAIEFINCY
jgi:hypothetical protein